MSGLQLNLLGGFELLSPSGALIPLARKPALLLAYLALQLNRPHSREKLAGLFWSDSGEIQARNSFRQALAVLRDKLRPYDDVLVMPEAETIAVACDALVTDVAEFERSLKQGTRASLERAVNLYEGELLANYQPRERPLEEWLAAERRHRH